LLSGAGYLARGFGLWLTSPRLMLLGAVPALVVGAVYLVGLVLLVVNLDALVTWATPFADSWPDPVQLTTRITAALVVVAAAGVVVVYSFTAVTLAVGDPFYERIWRAVETTLGDPPVELAHGLWRTWGRAVADGIRLLVPAIGLSLLLLACGLIPFVGPVLAVALGALVGGWLLTVELTSWAFDARGFSVRERRAALRDRRAVSVGFGASAYLLFLVPFLAVVAMPAAVAGAAMLSRDTLAGSAPRSAGSRA